MFGIKQRLINIIVELMMLCLSLIIIVPILLMILGSFKDAAEAAKVSLSLPGEWNFDNYVFAFKEGKMARAFFNSVFITFCSVFITVICSSACGYVVSRRKNGLSKGIYNYFFIGMVAPYQIVTTFLLFKFCHISGYLSVIILFIAINLPFSIILFEGFIKNIPLDIDESAAIDGSSPLRTFSSIIFPLLKPVTVTCIITVSIAVWNEFMIPLYLLSSSKYWTLPLTVYNFFGQYSSNWNYVFANLIICSLPILILYLLLQKHIIAGMTAGAVKA